MKTSMRVAGWIGLVVAQLAGADLAAVAAESAVLFDNNNAYGVLSNPAGPPARTQFALAAPHVITFVQTYHYFNRGTPPGTIRLIHQDGTVYGPWQAQGSVGQGAVANAYWEVTPNVAFKAGVYSVEVSSPATWSHNPQSKSQGFVVVKGYPSAATTPQGEPAPTDARGQLQLGWKYESGKGMPKDLTQAVYWYRKAAEQGFAEGQCSLGWMYANGSGVARDDALAAHWYGLAADQGHARGQYNLGTMLLNGSGVTKNAEKGVDLLRKSAANGYADAGKKLEDMGVSLQAPPLAEIMAPATPPQGIGSSEWLANLQHEAAMNNAPMAETPPPLDFARLTAGQYAGAISAAKEGMRLVYGEMTPEDEKKFDEKWEPMLAFPDKDAIDWCNRLNPPLSQFLGLRTAMNQASLAFDQSQAEILSATEFGDEDALQAAMVGATARRDLLLSLNKALEQATQEIEAIGDPPDTRAAMNAARKLHKEALDPAQFNDAPGPFDVRLRPPNPQRGWYYDEANSKEIVTENYTGGDWIGSRSVFKVGSTERLEKSGSILIQIIGSGTNEANSDVQFTVELVSRMFGGTWVSMTPYPDDFKEYYRGYEIQNYDLRKGLKNPSGIRLINRSIIRDNALRSVMLRYVDGGVNMTESMFTPGKVAPDSPEYLADYLEMVKTLEIVPGGTGRIIVDKTLPPPPGEIAKPAPVPAEKEKPATGTEADAEATAKAAQIEYQRNEIQIWETELGKLQQELGRTTDPGAKKDLEYRIMSAQDWKQRASEQIAQIETGTFAHAPTEMDGYNEKLMAAQGVEMAERWQLIQNYVERGPKLIAMAPPDEREQLQKFYDSHITPEAMAKGDIDSMSQAMDAMGQKVRSLIEKDAADAYGEEVMADAKLRTAESVKAGADAAMMALSMAPGGQVVQAAYMGGTGYIEGGPGLAVRRAATGYSAAAMLANQTVESYEKDGLRAAAWTLGSGMALQGAMKLTLNSLSKSLAGQPYKVTIKDKANAMEFQKRTAMGKQRVEEMGRRIEDKQAYLKSLKAQGRTGQLTPEEIARVRQFDKQIEAAAADIKVDYHAKLHLKNNTDLKAMGKDLTKIYSEIDQKKMTQVLAAVEEKFKQNGWGPQKLRTFRNAASKGSVGMDEDVGILEPSRFIKAGDKMVANPAHAEWVKGIAQNGQNRSSRELQDAGHKYLKEAFSEVYERNTDEALLEFTTSFHPEAYGQMAWLGRAGRAGSKTADITTIDRLAPSQRGVQQAADVTAFKVNNLQDHATLNYFSRLQEQCRGLEKDFDTKLAPYILRSKSKINPEMSKHVTALREVMKDFSKNKIGPIEADQQIKQLTGGQGIASVADGFRVMLESFDKMPK